MPDAAAILNLLRRLIDPEAGINIVGLGLVYRVEADAGRVQIGITMTSPACPLGEMITDEVKDVLANSLPPGCAVEVRRVWDPPWQPSMMSEAGRLHFGWEA